MRPLLLVQRWARLRPAERRLAVQAWCLLAACGALLRCVSLDRLVSWQVPFAGVRDVSFHRMVRIIAAVAVVHPSCPRCLGQALVATWALRAAGATPQLVLGRASLAPFAAHAWVRVDGHVLLGGDAVHRCDELHAFIPGPEGG